MYLSEMLRRRRLLLGRKPYEGVRWMCYPRKRVSIANGLVPKEGMVAGPAHSSRLVIGESSVRYRIEGGVKTDYDGLFSVSIEPGQYEGSNLFYWTSEGDGKYTVRMFMPDTPYLVTAEGGTYPDNGFKSPNYYYRLGQEEKTE